MTTAETPSVPLDVAKEIARSLSYDAAAAALAMFADTFAQVRVGSGCEQTRRGAEAMRRRVVKAARVMAAKWRKAAAGVNGPSPA